MRANSSPRPPNPIRCPYRSNPNLASGSEDNGVKFFLRPLPEGIDDFADDMEGDMSLGTTVIGPDGEQYNEQAALEDSICDSRLFYCASPDHGRNIYCRSVSRILFSQNRRDIC